MDINCNPTTRSSACTQLRRYAGAWAEYGSQMVRGLLDGGVYCSLKHFPAMIRRWIPTLVCLLASTAALTS